MVYYLSWTWRNYGNLWIFLLSKDWNRITVLQKRRQNLFQKEKEHTKGKNNVSLLQTVNHNSFSPPLSTGHTFNEYCHRLISTSCLLLLILCFIRTTTTTPETATEMVHHVCFNPVGLGSLEHLLFDHVTLQITISSLSHFFLHFITHHLIGAHMSQTRR